MKATLSEARAARPRAREIFSQLVGEVAIGLTRLPNESYALKVNLSEAPADEASLPNEVDGVPIICEVVGRIRKQ